MHKKLNLYISLWIIAFLIFPDFSMAFSISSSTINLDQPSKEIIAHMTLEEKIGQMLMVDFQGTNVSANLLKIMKEIKPGGLILYGGNISTPLQTVNLTSQLQSYSAIPLFIATDQEGGEVSRINGGTIMPAALALGAAGSLQLGYQAGLATGRELKSIGINIDLAPVIDVLHEPDKASLGSRCFSSDPTTVSAMGLAFSRGLSDAGVIAGIKHFPGHGSASSDSHLDIPLVETSRSQLNIDLKPFLQLFSSGAELVMTAHVAYPTLDSTHVISRKTKKPIVLPASLSSDINTGLARREMGYQGVIMTDSLYMRPVMENFGSQEEAAVMAVQAGADLLLIQNDPFKVKQRMVKAVQNGEISEARVDESLQRLLLLKQKRSIITITNGKIKPGTAVIANLTNDLKQKTIQMVGNPEHRKIEQDIANQAVTLLLNQGQALPWKLQEGQRIVYFVPLESIKPAADIALSSLAARSGLKKISTQGFVYRTLSQPTGNQIKAVAEADFIIVLCKGDYLPDFRANKPNPQRDFLLKIAARITQMGKPLLVLTSAPPRDKAFFSSVTTCLLTYGCSQVNINAGLLAAFGLIKPAGHLPFSVNSPDHELLLPFGYGLTYE